MESPPRLPHMKDVLELAELPEPTINTDKAASPKGLYTAANIKRWYLHGMNRKLMAEWLATPEEAREEYRIRAETRLDYTPDPKPLRSKTPYRPIVEPVVVRKGRLKEIPEGARSAAPRQWQKAEPKVWKMELVKDDPDPIEKLRYPSPVTMQAALSHVAHLVDALGKGWDPTRSTDVIWIASQASPVDRDLIAFEKWLVNTGLISGAPRAHVMALTLRIVLLSLRLEWADAFEIATGDLRIGLWIWARYCAVYAQEPILRSYALRFSSKTKTFCPKGINCEKAFAATGAIAPPGDDD